MGALEQQREALEVGCCWLGRVLVEGCKGPERRGLLSFLQHSRTALALLASRTCSKGEWAAQSCGCACVLGKNWAQGDLAAERRRICEYEAQLEAYERSRMNLVGGHAWMSS